MEILTETNRRVAGRRSPLAGAFFWLSAFYVVYCARPEEWIPGLQYIPVAKITGVLAFLGLIISLGRTQRKFNDLPRESFYLLAMIAVLSLSAVLSPVWRGGAITHTIDFAKVYVAWVLTFLLVTSIARLRRIIFVQSASVVVISAVSLIVGHSRPRLEGVIGGIYSNPNDLAFAVVLTLPFCLAFLLTSRNFLVKLAWVAGMLMMGLTLFLTASRAGFITLAISGAVALWHFGVKGRRLSLIVGSVFALMILLVAAGGPLLKRMDAIRGGAAAAQETSAYESFEQRQFLMKRAIQGIGHYPILGVGVRNFQVYSGVWRDVHMTYLQIAVEGGIPSLILYLMFFGSAFGNLKRLRRKKDLDSQTRLLVGALHSSMVGFAIGALFAPEAYQFFPYFAVAYTSALVATVAEHERAVEPLDRRDSPSRSGSRGEINNGATNNEPDSRNPDAVALIR
jgi:O-antigen ligase